MSGVSRLIDGVASPFGADVDEGEPYLKDAGESS